MRTNLLSSYILVYGTAVVRDHYAMNIYVPACGILKSVNLKFDWQIPNQISHAVFKISKHKISNLDCKFLFLNFLKRSDVKYLANKSQISMWTINSRTVVQLVLILITTLKPQSNGPSYSNTVITTLAWPLMGVLGTSRKGLGGAVARSGPSSLYQM